MQTHYNSLAGGEVGRIAALSDGLFAIAATILVLDFHTPEPADIHSEAEFLRALAASAPRLLPWLLSLLTLGIFWLGQQTQLSQLARSNRDLTWLHFLFLAIVTVLPFSTQAARRFPDLPRRLSDLLGQCPAPRRVSLRHLGVRRMGGPHSGGSARRHLARGQAAHCPRAVALCGRRALRARQCPARDYVHSTDPAELRDRAEAAHSLAALTRARTKTSMSRRGSQSPRGPSASRQRASTRTGPRTGDRRRRTPGSCCERTRLCRSRRWRQIQSPGRRQTT